jgi:acyl carrier protein
MNDIYSSGMPEGQPNHCPFCRSSIRIESSQPSGDAPCPKCGARLWFVVTGEGMRYYDFEKVVKVRKRLLETLRKRLRIGAEALTDSFSIQNDSGTDSLEIVEIVMLLEEQFGVLIPDSEAEEIQTLRDAIRYLEEHGPQ